MEVSPIIPCMDYAGPMVPVRVGAALVRHGAGVVPPIHRDSISKLWMQLQAHQSALAEKKRLWIGSRKISKSVQFRLPLIPEFRKSWGMRHRLAAVPAIALAGKLAEVRGRWRLGSFRIA